MQAILPPSAAGVAIIIGWISLALVNAGLAQGKLRRGWPWFLLSLPFGPLATLALVLAPRARKTLF